jgi:peptidoglycan-associated lipoprotein
MTFRTPRTVLALLAAATLLAACGTRVKLDEPARAPVTPAASPVTPGAGAGAAAGAANAAPAPASQVATVDLSRQNAAAAAPTQRIVYFDFDSFVVKPEFTPMLEGHARALAATPARRIVIEGHTDERGGREYNLALGQKRAEAVLRSLSLLGVADNRMEAVSFGKERPAVEGSNEAAWAQNRRAELKDR